MGRTAIEIAVDNENLEIVQLLLMQVINIFQCKNKIYQIARCSYRKCSSSKIY